MTRAARKPKLKYKVGDKIKWRGQSRWIVRIVRRITEPQPGNQVLWTGKPPWEFPIGHRQVVLVDDAPERGKPSKGRGR